MRNFIDKNSKKMAHPKQRSVLHIMEDDSTSIFMSQLPKEWVVRQYKPDYGIDLAVEVFDKVKGKKGMFETLGEHFFVQLKSCNQLEYTTINVEPRINVELGPLRKLENDESSELEVIKYVLETDLLLTVQNMGPAQVVILVLVDLSNEKTFFLCLNDYIDKCLIPEDPLYINKKHKTIYIPVSNEINRSNEKLLPLRFIAKRAKFYSAFEKFHFQKYQLDQHLDQIDSEIYNTLKTFINNILRLDVWRGTEMWSIMEFHHHKLLNLKKIIESKIQKREILLVHFVKPLWHGLCALSWSYEEMCREWFLPTHLAIICSTPNEYTLSKNPITPIRAGCVSYSYLKKRNLKKR